MRGGLLGSSLGGVANATATPPHVATVNKNRKPNLPTDAFFNFLPSLRPIMLVDQYAAEAYQAETTAYLAS
jgi:hypothetical protein